MKKFNERGLREFVDRTLPPEKWIGSKDLGKGLGAGVRGKKELNERGLRELVDRTLPPEKWIGYKDLRSERSEGVGGPNAASRKSKDLRNGLRAVVRGKVMTYKYKVGSRR